MCVDSLQSDTNTDDFNFIFEDVVQMASVLKFVQKRHVWNWKKKEEKSYLLTAYFLMITSNPFI